MQKLFFLFFSSFPLFLKSSKWLRVYWFDYKREKGRVESNFAFIKKAPRTKIVECRASICRVVSQWNGNRQHIDTALRQRKSMHFPIHSSMLSLCSPRPNQGNTANPHPCAPTTMSHDSIYIRQFPNSLLHRPPLEWWLWKHFRNWVKAL